MLRKRGSNGPDYAASGSIRATMLSFSGTVRNTQLITPVKALRKLASLGEKHVCERLQPIVLGGSTVFSAILEH